MFADRKPASIQMRGPASADAATAGPSLIPTRQVLATLGAILGVSGIAFGVVGALSAAVAYSAARARGIWGEDEPPEGIAEEVVFQSADDETRICGWFFRQRTNRPAPAVVLCHGAWTGRRECLPMALRLHRAGYSVLCFDFRAHGESAGRYISVGHHEVKDVLGAVEFVRDQPEVDPTRVGIIGFSMGAASAIQAAARSREIAAVVADSAYADFVDAVEYSFRAVRGLPHFPFGPLALAWGSWLVQVDPKQLRPVEHAGRIAPTPLLLIHGQEDEVVPVRHAYLLYKAARGPKELWMVPGARHVGARDLHPDEYFERVHGFLGRAFEAAERAETQPLAA